MTARRLTGRIAAAALGLMAIAEAASAADDAPAASAIPAEDTACPQTLPAGARCYSGRSAAGAWYWIAVPQNWNGALVVHAHGGPRSQEPERNDAVEDLERFSVLLDEGFALTASTYRRGGYGVRMAAEDTDQLRQIVWDKLGRPAHTLLHGQSWGGNVAAKAAELYALDSDGRRNYDGVVLTSGVLSGGTRAYGFRADLRAVYQFYCHNHPRSDETVYPLWQGLPDGASMSRTELAARVSECTGADAATRTPEQARNLRNILGVTGVSEEQLVAHLNWATTLFQDMVSQRLGGKNPFSNADTVYTGSDDDAALNAGVERFAADPEAVAQLAYDADLSGLIVLPTLTIHGKADATAFVWHEAVYRETVAAAGRSDLLVQTVTTEAEHGKLSAPEYAALFRAMMVWIVDGTRPTPSSVSDLCAGLADRYGQPCLFDNSFVPAMPATR